MRSLLLLACLLSRAAHAAASAPAPPRSEYPEPQFMRPDWQSLNGRWQFAFDDDDVGLTQHWEAAGHSFHKTIVVPYCFESKLSGIADTSFHPVVWYQRSIRLPAAWKRRHVLLRFGAVDYRASVWVDGQLAGTHEGGNVPFLFDITPLLNEGAATVVVRAEDPPRDRSIPRGKQYWEPKSKAIFYTRTSGIWQPVWVEATGADHLLGAQVVTDAAGSIALEAQLATIPRAPLQFTADILDGTLSVLHLEATTVEDRVAVRGTLAGVKPWSPGDPHLYSVRYQLRDKNEAIDDVESYIGFRTIKVAGGRVTINGQPVYLKFLLDQGYWPESVLTPPSDDAIKRDLDLVTSMGFNGVRKHQKVADPRFLFWADQRGILVSGEMADAYEFNEAAVRRFTEEWIAAVRRDFNHPSVIIWNAINESWGVPDLNDVRQQAYLKSLYQLTHTLDPTRLVIDNEGWQHTDQTDLFAIHDYQKSGEVLYERYKGVAPDSKAVPRNGRDALIPGYRYNGSPLYLSEFGGIAYIPPGAHVPPESWGYSGVEKTAQSALARLTQLYEGLTRLTNFAGMCYTQLTDVEQEVNGLVTFDRQPKYDIGAVKALNERLHP